MDERNGNLQLLQFSETLEQPREVYPKFRRNFILENFCSIPFLTRNFRIFLMEWKAPQATVVDYCFKEFSI